jgi:hypothetical protein
LRKADFVSATAAFVALGGAAFAEDQKPAATSTYVVLQENVDIPFARRNINGFSVGDDNSLILQVGAGRYYRATLSPPCGRDLKWEHKIAIDYDLSGRFDRFSKVIVDGRRCFVQSLDRIESPRLTKKKAAEAAASHS